VNGPYERHAFVCLGGKSCPALGSEAVFAALKAKVADASLRDRVRVNKAGCMSQCGNGPMVCLYPDNVWYAGVRPEDADAIFAHLCGGPPHGPRLYRPAKPGSNQIA